jgi:hypothetical protein
MEWRKWGMPAERLHHIPNGLLLPQRALSRRLRHRDLCASV